MGLLIRNGHLIDPAHDVNGKHDLFLNDGFVAALDHQPEDFVVGRVIDAQGLVVCPGLVDICARLREPGLEHKARLESEIQAAVAAGVTRLSVPPDTNPVIDTPAMAQMIQQRAWQLGKAFIHPVGGLTKNLEGKFLTDMAALDDAGCVAVSNALQPVRDTVVMRRAMQYASTFDLTVFLHAEDPWLRGNGCVHEGFVSTRLGLPAIPEAAETVGVARDLALIETTGARCHFSHLSSARAVEMVAEARHRGLPVTADVAAHQLHLTENDIGFFNTQCHVIPPLRTERDREKLRRAVKDGVITAICSDHQPHETDAKLAPFSESEPGISGLETLLPLTLKLVEEKLLSLPEAIATLTHSPARILGVDSGHLRPGAAADVCIFDPEQKWVFERERMVSRGRNTPFHGWTFKGRVTHVLIGGEVVHEAAPVADRDEDARPRYAG